MIHEIVPIKLENNSKDACLKLTCYEKSDALFIKERPFILIIPGGGYCFVSARESDPIANSFLAMGYNVGILNYSVAPYSYPVSYLEAFTALKYVLDNAGKLNVDKSKIVVCGFSAGGHLAGMVGTGFNDPLILDYFKAKENELKVAGMVLVYPVINGGEFAHRGSFDALLAENKNDKEWIEKLSIDNRVTPDTPKTFLWSTYEDKSVPCENTFMMCNALRKNNVPFEMHLFQIGGHGLALANEQTRDAAGTGIEPYCSKWMGLCKDWLELLFQV